MRLLSQKNDYNQDNFAKTTSWVSRKHISIVYSIINAHVAEKAIFSVHRMPTNWGNSPK